ncbi:MAG: trypsin-like peptidase domain-containing protein [Myxococcaceae bacterium]|nr:trypsin-like peptidase domain-containing protein [Myxococcaceae bacterium]
MRVDEVTRCFRGPLCLAVLLLAKSALADDAEAWVRERIAEQRAALKARAAAADDSRADVAAVPQPNRGTALWRERAPDAGAPNFELPTSMSFAPLVKAVRPGVVNVSTTGAAATRSLGSGFVISAEGLVVTNNHVIERAAVIRVRLADGRQFEADVVGQDSATDLALLRLRGTRGAQLPSVFLGDSDKLEVGDWVVAIGNPFGLDMSVTHGIISARERVIGVSQFDDFIQTNALINPGNSGGPLFNLRGEVVGVTTAVISQGQGIGFAVPINLVKDLLPNLLVNGKPARAWLGINISEESDGSGRLPTITEVYPESPAQKAGLKTGDRIVAVNGRPAESYAQLLRRIALLVPGTQVKLKVLRAGRELEIEVTLIPRPSEAALASMPRLNPDAADRWGVKLAQAQQGVLIESIDREGRGAQAGLKEGDVIVEVNGQRVMSPNAVERAIANGSSEDVLLKVQRGSGSQLVAIHR